MTSAEHPRSDLEVPEPAGLLLRLADTVRTSLAPSATDPVLSSELHALASTLRLLGEETPRLGETSARMRDAARDALPRSGRAEDGDSVRALAGLIRGWADGGQRTADELKAAEEFAMSSVAYGHGATLSGTPRAARRQRKAEGDGAGQPSLRDRVVLDKLAGVLGEALAVPGLEITGSQATTEGFAAETVIVTLGGGSSGSGTGTGAEPRKVVVRAQWPGLVLSEIPQPIRQQTLAARTAARVGLPVPEVLFVTDDPGPVGAPIIVTDHVEGVVPAGWTPDGRRFMERLRTASWPRFIEDAVTLHSAPWAQDPQWRDLVGDRTVTDRLRARLTSLTGLYRRTTVAPDPLLELAFLTLTERVDQWGEEVLIHGDYRPGNLIYSPDGAVRAIIDWDAAKVTDVHEELAQLLLWAYRDRDGLALGLVDDDTLLETYTRISGRVVDDVGLAYYRLLTTVQHYIVFSILVRSWWDRGGAARMARSLFTLKDCREHIAHHLGVLRGLGG